MQEIQPACTQEDEPCGGRSERGCPFLAECGFELPEIELPEAGVGSSNRDIVGLVLAPDLRDRADGSLAQRGEPCLKLRYPPGW